MNRRTFAARTSARFTLSIGAAAALLTGCGGSQLPMGAPGAAVQKNVAGGLNTGDLIFASADRNASGYYLFAWSYPRGRFVKKISGGPGIGMCSDKSGNVWLAENGASALVEFDHSGSIEKQLNGISDPWGCSVDPSTGNLAAIDNESGDLVVWMKASGSGTAYQTSLSMGGYSCAYDDKGNLFGYGVNATEKGQLVELLQGGSTVKNIRLDQNLQGNGSIQWDGRYLAVQASVQNHDTVTIDRVQVSGLRARVVGTTQLISPSKSPQFGLSPFWVQGRTVMDSTGFDAKEIGLWNYPSGGKPRRLIKRSGGTHPYYIDGLTVSVAPK